MKITFLIQNFSRGHGSERVTALIASFLSNQGYDVNIVSVCGDNTSFYPIAKDVKLYTLISRQEIDNKKSFFRVLKAYDLYLHKWKPDVVIDVFAAMSIYTLMLQKRYGYKNITWEHYNYYNNSGIYRFSRRIAILKSDYIITLTKTDLETYIRFNQKLRNRIEYIYNPTPFENPPFVYEEKEKFVLAVGRLVRIKGYNHLIDIWSLVESRCPKWKLIIVGEGDQRMMLQEQIRRLQLERVYLPGETSNVEEYYKKASLLVSTSDFEGLPMNMIEGQSFGVPIISYDYYSGPRDIITEGADGYIISGNSQEEKNANMAECMIKCMNNSDLLKHLMIEAKKNSNRFLMKNIGIKWINTIEELVK